MPAWPPTGFVRDTWNRQHKMGLHFPLNSPLTIPCNHFLQYSHRFCPTTPLPESFVTHTRPLVQGVGSFGSAQTTNGASQAPPGKRPHDARHVYWNRNLDRQVHIQNREMPQTGLHLFGIGAGGPQVPKKSCGLSGLQSASLVALH